MRFRRIAAANAACSAAVESRRPVGAAPKPSTTLSTPCGSAGAVVRADAHASRAAASGWLASAAAAQSDTHIPHGKLFQLAGNTKGRMEPTRGCACRLAGRCSDPGIGSVG